MRDKDGYPSSFDTTLVPALITILLDNFKSARHRMLILAGIAIDYGQMLGSDVVDRSWATKVKQKKS